jgi:predicted ribosome quality control (RQC) complex YloA/Tae2 family protein
MSNHVSTNGGGVSNSSSSKGRFDGLDVQAMVAYLQHSCIGRRIVNIYDGSNSETYIFKLDGTTTITAAASSSTSTSSSSTNTGSNNNDNNVTTTTTTTMGTTGNPVTDDSHTKQFLLLESGIRFHTISNFTSEAKTPTPFCMKLRKHLRGLRVELIQQIGTDRVVLIQCGVGHYKHTIILELYAKGNLIVTDNNYVVIALLRSHTYNNNNNHSTSTSTSTETTAPTTPSHMTSSNNKNDKRNSTTNDDSTSNTAVFVQVGQVYPVTYATSIGNTIVSNNNNEIVDIDPTTTINSAATLDETTTVDTTSDPMKQSKSLLQMDTEIEFNEWIGQYIESTIHATTISSTLSSKKKKKLLTTSITLKVVLSQNNDPINVIHHYGPALIEHCIRMAQLNPNENLVFQQPQQTTADDANNNDNNCNKSLHIKQYTFVEWKLLREILQNEGTRILHCLKDGKLSSGYILYRPIRNDSSNNVTSMDKNNNDTSQVVHDTSTMEVFDFTDKILIEFQPVLLEQHKALQYIQFINFALAVEIYFDHMAEQRNTIKALNAEKAVINKLEKVRIDQQERIEMLYEQQSTYQQQAETVQYHADQVDKAILVINSAISSGMSWDQIEQIVQIEQTQNHNPIALLIYKLDLENDAMILRLPIPNTNGIQHENEQDNNDNNNHLDLSTINKTLDVHILLQESAYANSNRLFAQYRAMKEKSKKTIEASSKALKAAEEMAKKQLLEAQKRTQRQNGSNGMTMIGKRKVGWYEKFHWFITTDNYLVIGGRDAQQNELLVKRYLRTGDAYVHADIHGASSCIVRAKRRRYGNDNTKTQVIPLSEQALREAGNFTICHSNAWTSRIITSAWWVEAYQVSKTAPTGEYLTIGSFMIRGKKNFLPPSSLEMGLGVLFRLGDDESILRHVNERRDFSLLNDVENIDSIETNNGHDIDRRTNGERDRLTEKSSPEPQVDCNEDERDHTPEDKTDDVELHVHDEQNEECDLIEREQSRNENSEEDYDDALEPYNNETAAESIVNESVNSVQPIDHKNQNQAQKRGPSVRDRKLIKKYGSLEAAEAILSSQPQQTKADPDDDADTLVSSSVQKQTTLKRGQKSKLKRVEKKYIDQDDDDRELAMLALQGGEKQKNKKLDKKSGKGKIIASEKQQKVAAETVALLVKDSTLVIQQLPTEVTSLLAECVTVSATTVADNSESVVHWEKFDADTLEQLLSLTPLEAQITAAKRLLNLKQSTRIDNFSASLGGTYLISAKTFMIYLFCFTHQFIFALRLGIIRTIRKHGYKSIDINVDPSNDVAKRKTKAEKEVEAAKWKEVLDDEGVVAGDIDIDAIDDTVEISKLTGKPHADDLLLYAIPVCGPYQSLSQYTYRVKLTPGSMKRGKSSKQCLDILLKTPSTSSICMEKHLELIKRVAENDWVQTILADVKISAAGASKVAKQNKANTKKSK